MENKIDKEKLLKNLNKFGYEVSCFADKEAAADYLDKKIDNCTVGLGDSQTLVAMDIHNRLAKHNRVFDPATEFRGDKDFNEAALETLNTEVFLCSVNALAETGELVNIDRRGNRVAGTLFGHKKVYIVVGTNKVMPDLEKAIWRARNVAAPQNAKRKNYRTPCAVKGDKCYDCSSPERICGALVVHLRKMYGFDTEIVLIDENLGL